MGNSGPHHSGIFLCAAIKNLEVFSRKSYTLLKDFKEEKPMSEMMWALVKEKAERGLWLKRVPVPETGKNDVKIKIHKTSICGTDVHIYN